MALRSYYGNGSDHFPGHMAAFRFLREVEGTQDKNWKGLLAVADEGLQAPLLEEDLAVLAAEAGEIAAKELEDITLAAGYFDWVRKIDSDNPYLVDFIAEHPDAFEALEAEVAAGEPSVEEEIAIEAGEPEAPSEDEAPATVEVEAVSVEEPAEEPEEASAEEPEEASAEEPEASAEEEPEEETAEEPDQVVVTVSHEDAEAAQAAAEEEPAEEETAEEPEEPEEEASVDEEPAEEPEETEETGETAEEEPEEEPLAAEEAEAAPPAPVPSEIDEEVDEASAALFAAAAQAEAESREKGINAWRKATQKARQYRTPKRALARLYEAEQRWNPLVEVLKDEVELVSDVDEKIAILSQMAEIYRDQLSLDAMVVKTLIRDHQRRSLTAGGDGRPGGPVREDEALDRPDRHAQEEGRGHRRRRGEGRRSGAASPTCSSSASPTRPRRSRPTSR